jgi:hypothetical protein
VSLDGRSDDGAALSSTGVTAPSIHPEQAVLYLAEAVS